MSTKSLAAKAAVNNVACSNGNSAREGSGSTVSSGNLVSESGSSTSGAAATNRIAAEGTTDSNSAIGRDSGKGCVDSSGNPALQRASEDGQPGSSTSHAAEKSNSPSEGDGNKVAADKVNVHEFMPSCELCEKARIDVLFNEASVFLCRPCFDVLRQSEGSAVCHVPWLVVCSRCQGGFPCIRLPSTEECLCLQCSCLPPKVLRRMPTRSRRSDGHSAMGGSNSGSNSDGDATQQLSGSGTLTPMAGNSGSGKDGDSKSSTGSTEERKQWSGSGSGIGSGSADGKGVGSNDNSSVSRKSSPPSDGSSAGHSENPPPGQVVKGQPVNRDWEESGDSNGSSSGSSDTPNDSGSAENDQMDRQNWMWIPESVRVKISVAWSGLLNPMRPDGQSAFIACASSSRSSDGTSSGTVQPNNNNVLLSTGAADLSSLLPAHNTIMYSPQERILRIQKFRAKRQQRRYGRKIKYEMRQVLATKRPRIHGRFVKELPEETQAGGFEANGPHSKKMKP